MTINNIERIFLATILSIIILYGKCVKSMKYNCSQVIDCPTDIICPSDSYLKDIENSNNNNNVTNLIINDDEINRIDNNHDEICCLAQKCTCKLCHRPTCNNNSLVLMETIKETNIPGKCCGEYECKLEPNCTIYQTTNGYGWLIDCQRCECFAGQRICHKFCDEIRLPPANCIGQNSKIFSNGQTWKENECTFCECHNGEKKCQTSFCKSLSCSNKIKLPGECCAICAEESTTIITKVNKSEIVSISTPSSSSVPPQLPPCILATKDTSTTTTPASETYSVRTEYIESHHHALKQNCILYGIIAALSIILIIFITLYCYEKSKQRQYRPIVSLDDNCNNIIKAKIRKL